MATEHPDAEQALLKALAEVNKFKWEFKKTVNSLKTQYGKLDKRVESLELLGFQEQLDRLNERVKEMSSGFIELNREIYSMNLFLSGLLASNQMHSTGHVPPIPKTWEQSESDCISELKIYYVQAEERMSHCQNIKDMKEIVSDFWKKANEILHSFDFPELEQVGF